MRMTQKMRKKRKMRMEIMMAQKTVELYREAIIMVLVA